VSPVLILNCFLTFIDIQENQKLYPTLARTAMDVLPAQASSVPCERLFSSGKLIATDKRSRLGHECFEELQILKFAWCSALVNHAAENSDEVEDLELSVIQDFTDLLKDEQDILEWEKENPYLWVDTIPL
jgi:hypothetical protein